MSLDFLGCIVEKNETTRLADENVTSSLATAITVAVAAAFDNKSHSDKHSIGSQITT